MLFRSVVIPWIRLSVIGSVSYETYAASQIKQAAGVASLTENLQVYSTAIWTMTLSILSGMIILIFFYKRYTDKLEAIKQKNQRWSELLIAALFMGLVGTIGAQQITMGGYNAMALFISIGFMAVIGLISRKFKWMEEFALPVSMLGTLIMLYFIIGV